MEHSIPQDTEKSVRHENNWQPRPEFLQAMQNIATITEGDDTAVVKDREISFTRRAQRTTITASNVDVVTVDGLRISERIDIRTPLPAPFCKLTPEQIAMANTLATTGAIVIDPDSGGAVLVSCLAVFEVDTEALRDLYTPLVADASQLQVFGAIAAVGYMPGSTPLLPENTGIPEWDRPSLWREEEFDYTANRLRSVGIYCNAGATGLTAEFPWEQGASSAMLGETTSLFRLRTDTPHPVVGNGLFFKLSLPINLPREQLAACANYLNVFEMNGVDTPPFFGAWCSRLDDGTLSYVGFWPNCMYQCGKAANIAAWCYLRSRIARQVIGNM